LSAWIDSLTSVPFPGALFLWCAKHGAIRFRVARGVSPCGCAHVLHDDHTELHGPQRQLAPFALSGLRPKMMAEFLDQFRGRQACSRWRGPRGAPRLSMYSTIPIRKVSRSKRRKRGKVGKNRSWAKVSSFAPWRVSVAKRKTKDRIDCCCCVSVVCC
jgi:hypothetical protein